MDKAGKRCLSEWDRQKKPLEREDAHYLKCFESSGEEGRNLCKGNEIEMHTGAEEI